MSAIQNCFLFSECNSLNGATGATPAALAAQAAPVGGPAQAPATGNFFFVFFGGKNLRREGDFFNAPQQDFVPHR